MPQTIRLSAWFLSLAMATGTLAAEKEIQGWKFLFNGQDLDGWTVVGKGDWTVEEGAIVGQEGADASDHSWLVSNESYADFVFHARFKWERGNSGIQFHSDISETSLAGYQADLDLDSDSLTGALYDLERGLLAEAPQNLKDEISKNDWNEYEIVCAGDRIRLYLNGRQTIDLKDSQSKEGRFAFQVHAGDGCRVHWKDIRILELDPGQDFVPMFEGEDLEAGWYQVGEEKWSAKNGTVFGESGKGGYGWLVTDREYQDFVMNFRYKWTSGNSGVQFRSWLVGTEMHGLQADIDPGLPLWTGALYDEHERALLVQSLPEIDAGYDKNRWHSYQISAIGADIRLYHDGVLTAHFTEPDPKRISKGIISLQIHSVPAGQKVLMAWKDLRMLNLAPPSPWE